MKNEAAQLLIQQWRKEAKDTMKHDRYYRMALVRCANDLERISEKAKP